MKELWRDVRANKPEAVVFCLVLWPIGIPIVFAVCAVELVEWAYKQFKRAV